MRNPGYDMRPTLRPPRTKYERLFCPHGVREQYAKGEAEVREQHHGRVRRAEKQREETVMDNTTRVLKNAKALGEAGMYRLIQKYADSVRLPNESSAAAFARVFTAQNNEGQALRTVYAVAKGMPIVKNDETADEVLGEDDGDDVYELIEEKARELRRRNPELTAAQAFARAFAENPGLAKRERAQALRKMGVA